VPALPCIDQLSYFCINHEWVLKNGKQVPSLDDLAFEGRNREYGAYLIRKSYGSRLLLSLALALLSVALLLVSYISTSHLHETDFYLNPNPGTRTVGVDLSKKPYGISQLKPPSRNTLLAPKVVQELPPEKAADATKDIPEGQDADSSAATGKASGSAGNQSGATDSGIVGEVFGSADVNPVFPGGTRAMQEFIRENVVYPDHARAEGIKGTILIYVVITRDGELRDIKVVRGLQPELDREVMRVIASMPAWTPAYRGGQPVNVHCILPVSVSPIK
jgi:periplasmic protein TonB